MASRMNWRAAVSPWTCAGVRDPDVDEAACQAHRALLTDPSLLTCFRRRFPAQRDADYDEMVRLLGWVWDCPRDGAANVTGYCCARCGQTRAAACAVNDRRGEASSSSRPRL